MIKRKTETGSWLNDLLPFICFKRLLIHICTVLYRILHRSLCKLSFREGKLGRGLIFRSARAVHLSENST